MNEIVIFHWQMWSLKQAIMLILGVTRVIINVNCCELWTW